LIFDTLETPIAAEDLRVDSNFLARNPITWIVNSHTHSDHWFGNQVFNENTITCSIYCEVDCEIREARKSFEDIMQLELSEPYDTWSVGSSRQEINCQYLI